METFFGEIRGSVANLIAKELQDLNLVKVQTMAWIRFKVEFAGEDGSVIRVDMVDKPFKRQMMEVFWGSNLDEMIEEMLTHMRMHFKNPALVNSRFMFN